MMLLAGAVLILLGLGSGAALVASSVGWLTVPFPATLWIMFPLGSALGLLVAALGARTRAVPALLRTTGTVMFLLALFAVATLVLGSAGIIAIAPGTAALWYVFGVGLIVGIANFLAPAPPGQPA